MFKKFLRSLSGSSSSERRSRYHRHYDSSSGKKRKYYGSSSSGRHGRYPFHGSDRYRKRGRFGSSS